METPLTKAVVQLEQIAQQGLFFATNDRGLGGACGLAFSRRLFKAGRFLACIQRHIANGLVVSAPPEHQPV